MNASQTINRLVNRFDGAKESARRFHKEEIGDVDPAYCLGDFLSAIAGHETKRLERIYRCDQHKAAITEQGGTVGGYIVPTDLSTALLETAAEENIMRRYATVIPMTKLEQLLPWPDFTTAQSAGTSPFFAGIALSWSLDGRFLAETEPTFREISLRCSTLGGYVIGSKNVADDSMAINFWLTRLFGASLGWYEDLACFAADGVGKPQGVISAPGTIAVTRNTGGQVKTVDCQGMLAKLIPSAFRFAFWVVHPSTLPQVTALSGFIPNQARQVGDADVGSLYTLPVLVSEKVSTLGTKGDVVLLDARRYVIGDRNAIEIAVSDHAPEVFLKYRRAWRLLERVDGTPLLNAPVTLQDGSSTASAYVVLN